MDKLVNLDSPSLSFEVSLYGEMEKISDTLSKCRVRIFYKGLNRNRTFITDDFANQLIKSLPYSPIKGIWDSDIEDYEDHGKNSQEGRIYAVVAAEPNFAWEDHLDKDNKERTYACADAIVFTALYPEANELIGKGQSMEIYPKTMRGEWRIWEDGKPYFHFLSGSLLGLQILGEDVEPCFQGAAFYSYYKQAVEDVVRYSKKIQTEEAEKMDKNLFRLSDDEKYELIWDSINTEFNEENNWKVSYVISKIYDDYALCFKRKEDGKCQAVRVYYTKDNETNSVSIGEFVDVNIVDVTDTEYTALETMKAIGGTFEKTAEKIEEDNASLENYKLSEAEKDAKISELETQINEFTVNAETLNATITELETAKTTLEEESTAKYTSYEEEISNLNAEKVRLENEKNDITNENKVLAEFKLNVENKEKLSILGDFVGRLSEEQYSDFENSVSNYTVEDFKKEICSKAYDNNPSMFSLNTDSNLIPTNPDNTNVKQSGAIELIEKYKGGNK